VSTGEILKIRRALWDLYELAESEVLDEGQIGACTGMLDSLVELDRLEQETTNKEEETPDAKETRRATDHSVGSR